jgi:hypothetical protein
VSKLIGERLVEELRAAFDGDDLAAKIGPAYLLVTTDEDGTPRPCMLSAGEILAPDDRHLRVALWSGTTTGANLARGARVLFCYVAPGSVFYVKGRSSRLADGATTGLECFEITVEAVESDVHTGMPVDSPITFEVDAGDATKVAASWERQIADLRQA